MRRKRKSEESPGQMLLNLGFPSKPVEARPVAVLGRIRLGMIRPPVFIEDIDRINGPHGDGAQDAFERDMAMMEAEMEDGTGEFPGDPLDDLSPF